MQYLADPAPQQTAAPYDDSALKARADSLEAAIGQLIQQGQTRNATDVSQSQAIVALTARLDAFQTSQGQFTKVVDTKWFDTPFATRYQRNVPKASISTLSLEYKRTDNTVVPFSLADFVTGFAYSGFWNGTSDPNGLTRFISGTDIVVVSWDGTGEKLTLAATTKGSVALQIRKVRVNDQPLDWLPIYEPPI